MTARPQLRAFWPLLVIVAIVAVGPVLASCAPSTPLATPTPTKTPRPDATAAATAAPTMEQSASATEPPATAANPAPAGGTAAPSATAEPAKPTDAPTAAATQSAATAAPKPVGSGDGQMTSPDFGVQAFLWWQPEAADRDLGLVKDAGFRWVKQLFSWQDIEGAGKGQFDWSRTDRIVDQVERAGLELIVRLSEDPDRPFWAGTAPENSGDFADFVAAVASRYAGRIEAYQIWNEPNLAREWGKKRPDPAGYARMLKMAYSAIKAMDSSALVVTAGMAPTGTDSEIAMPDIRFYEQMYAAMGGNSDGYFDMLGVHAAGFAAAPEVSPDEAASNKAKYGGERFFAFRHVEDVRKVMEKNGDSDKRVVILEFGWTTDNRADSPYYWHGAGAGIDEALKGKYLVRAYEWAKANWQPWIALMTVIYMPDVAWTKDTEQYYWSVIGPGYPDLFLRAAYVELCIYINKLEGERCAYDPNPQ